MVVEHRSPASVSGLSSPASVVRQCRRGIRPMSAVISLALAAVLAISGAALWHGSGRATTLSYCSAGVGGGRSNQSGGQDPVCTPALGAND